MWSSSMMALVITVFYITDQQQNGKGDRKSFGGFNNKGGGEQWECDKCGVANEAHFRMCKECKNFDKNADSSNDWECSCGFKNFPNRWSCFKCQTPNPNGGGNRKSFGGGQRNNDGGEKKTFPGDWDCPSCGVSNFAKRGTCFKCQTANPSGGFGDNWDCADCNFSNFPSRGSCFKCQKPNPNGGGGGGGGFQRKSFGGGGRGGRGGRGGGGQRGGRPSFGGNRNSGGDSTPNNKKITFDE